MDGESHVFPRKCIPQGELDMKGNADEEGAGNNNIYIEPRQNLIFYESGISDRNPSVSRGQPSAQF